MGVKELLEHAEPSVVRQSSSEEGNDDDDGMMDSQEEQEGREENMERCVESLSQTAHCLRADNERLRQELTSLCFELWFLERIPQETTTRTSYTIAEGCSIIGSIDMGDIPLWAHENQQECGQQQARTTEDDKDGENHQDQTMTTMARVVMNNQEENYDIDFDEEESMMDSENENMLNNYD